MAGHSQFANIKHRKGAQDAKRSRVFTKLRKEIIIAARSGSPSPELNPRLRAAIASAKAENLPKDKIEAAIKSAQGNEADDSYEEITYEGYGPGGTAIVVHALSNNRNRTAGELRHIFSRYGGKLGEKGSIAYLFDHVGLIVYGAQCIESFDDLFDLATSLGAIDLEEDGEGEDKVYRIICGVEDFGKVRDGLYERYSDGKLARLSWRPKQHVAVDSHDLCAKLTEFLNDLEENDDVQHVEGDFLLKN
ncbi:YebC/PmpR family DNA-binding transcriptional regulator [Anaplasma capra]|uniref:YebC/PmpR family DNA-binding transcriptional regulator n=1 Tax=Anaplasma capra TaxID=1562740 RepID=UPI0021D5B41A|nr:YebC/PmpR family DNA-binding transcriptional regulator [Anaplasma capra]MCU7611946.1 YebC/PmpR family DNA-binding transcriptional regulator [Anaplasma capra]MCU7612270.1 YebC/PmpR family DNA-binding transcriptional regulator [Anaplasma capra]